MLTVEQLKNWEDVRDLISSKIVQESQIDDILANVMANADSKTLTLTDFVFFVRFLNDALAAIERQENITDNHVPISSNSDSNSKNKSREKKSELDANMQLDAKEDDYLSSYDELKRDSQVSENFVLKSN